jgi:hypothetical protein
LWSVMQTATGTKPDGTQRHAAARSSSTQRHAAARSSSGTQRNAAARSSGTQRHAAARSSGTQRHAAARSGTQRHPNNAVDSERRDRATSSNELHCRGLLADACAINFFFRAHFT